MTGEKEKICLNNAIQKVEELTHAPKPDPKSLWRHIPNSGGPLWYPGDTAISDSVVAMGTLAGLIAHDQYIECLEQTSVPNVKPPRQR